MSAKMLVVDGIRIREEDAKARGLIGERKVPEKPAAVSTAQATPKNKSRKPAAK